MSFQKFSINFLHLCHLLSHLSLEPNYDNESHLNSSSSISPSLNPSLNFWNYLLFKPRKNNKNTKQTTLVNESKCLIVL
jgi:hypothetical protein